jgi:hypothetical protein
MLIKTALCTKYAVLTKFGMDDRSLISGKGMEFCLRHHCVQTAHGAHRACCLISTVALSTG